LRKKCAFPIVDEVDGVCNAGGATRRATRQDEPSSLLRQWRASLGRVLALAGVALHWAMALA
jgi:hypothetical protein